MVAEELLDWQLACDRFAREGDVRGMRACAQEVRAIGGAEAAREAQAMEADAALYAGDGGAALNGLKGLEIKPFSLFSHDFQQETETG